VLGVQSQRTVTFIFGVKPPLDILSDDTTRVFVGLTSRAVVENPHGVFRAKWKLIVDAFPLGKVVTTTGDTVPPPQQVGLYCQSHRTAYQGRIREAP
jgi:hypothetical protein